MVATAAPLPVTSPAFVQRERCAPVAESLDRSTIRVASDSSVHGGGRFLPPPAPRYKLSHDLSPDHQIVQKIQRVDQRIRHDRRFDAQRFAKGAHKRMEFPS